jgi:hypothetical protein
VRYGCFKLALRRSKSISLKFKKVSPLAKVWLMVGKTVPDERMIREISSLLYRLPAASTPGFTQEFEGSWGGVLLASLFTEILKGTGDIHEVYSLIMIFLIMQLSQKVAVMTETRRKRLGMTRRGTRMAHFAEPMAFDPFISGSWNNI